MRANSADFFALDEDDVNEEEQDKDWLVDDGKNRPHDVDLTVQDLHQAVALGRTHARCYM